MNTPDRLQALVAELGLRLKLNELQLDTHGGCAIELDRRITVNLQYRELEDELWLYADLGLAPMRSTAFYESLLQANLFWRQTAGGTLSLSGDEPPHVVLARSLEWLRMDISSFGAAVETFVNAVEDWQEQLIKADADTSASIGASASAAGVTELLMRSRA